jgi:YHYH protein
MVSRGLHKRVVPVAIISIVAGVVGTMKLRAQEGPEHHAFQTRSIGTTNYGEAPITTQSDTSSVLCDAGESTENASLGIESRSQWRCADGKRSLVSNGIPNHSTGSFPNENNPNKIAEQEISFTTTLHPKARNVPGVWVRTAGYAINGIKFEPGTAGRCESSITHSNQCSLGRGFGQWSIEALGQKSFDFGVDANRAHVQPTGEYHYHGIPEGLLSQQGKNGQSMSLIGWASDGFPIYARYGFSDPSSTKSPLKILQSSYSLRASPSEGRPSTALVPMGAFEQDYLYQAGVGDLDECNGRFAVTPEFPNGTYHYFATDTYPYVQRCVKGIPMTSENRPPRRGRPS